MTRFFQLMHRRSLTVSFVVLMLSLPTLGFLAEFAQRVQWHGAAFITQASVVVGLALIWCVGALMNLLADVRSGYSPHRCSIAAAFLFLAFVPPVLVAVQILRHAGNS